MLYSELTSMALTLSRRCSTQLHILAHHTKIPTRIEVFTSSSPAIVAPSRDTRESATFRRLGYVVLQSNAATGFSARELKIVRLERREKVTLIWLVLHRCHTTNTHNIFQQVGLLSVIACEAPAAARPSPHTRSVDLNQSNVVHGVLPRLQEERAESRIKFTTTTTPLNSHANAMNPSASSDSNDTIDTAVLSTSGAVYEVWIPELRAFTTPLEIWERIQASDTIAAQSGDTKLAQQWRTLRLECRHLLHKLSVLQRTFDATNHLLATDDDRSAMFEEIELVVQELGVLGSQAFMRALSLPPTRWKEDADSVFSALPDLRACLQSTSWETREDAVWRLTRLLRSDKHVPLRGPNEQQAPQDTRRDEGWRVAKQVLQDAHSQVFVAACSLLHQLLGASTSRPHRLARAPVSKTDVRMCGGTYGVCGPSWTAGEVTN